MGDVAQAFILEQHFDSVSGEALFVLPDDAPLGGLQDQEQIVLGERLAYDAHGQPPNELRFKSKVQEVPRYHLFKALFGFLGLGRARRKSDGGLTQAAVDDLFQATEGPADDKE